MKEPQTTPVDPRVHLQDALVLLRAAHAATPATLLAAREIEEAIDHAELAISDLDDGGTVEDVDDEDKVDEIEWLNPSGMGVDLSDARDLLVQAADELEEALENGADADGGDL